MAKVQVKRMSELIDKNTIRIDSVVSEVMGYAEYKAIFNKWGQEANNLKFTIDDLKNQLIFIGPVKDDPEVKRLKEMLVLAEKMKARDELQTKLQELEILFERKKEEIAALQPNFIRIQKTEKNAKLPD